MSQIQKLLDLFEQVKREVKNENPNFYERWKAGGFILDSNIVSMYPSLEEYDEPLYDEEEDEYDEEYEDDEN